MARLLIQVPEPVVRTAAAALRTRAERGGGGTRAAVMTATALTTGFLEPVELARLRAWHHANPDAVVGDASTLLAGLYGGPAARAWDTPRTAAALNPAGTGAMIALPVPAAVSQALARPDGEPADEMHLTLFHFGNDASELDPTIRDTIERVLSTIDLTAPTVDLTHVERFTSDDGMEPAAAVTDSPDVYALRDQLAEALDAAGVDYSDSHAFRGHVTIGYYPPGDGPEAGPLDQPLTMNPWSVLLVWGPDREEYPLLLPETPAPITAAIRSPLHARLAKMSAKVNATDRRSMTRLHSAATVALREAMRQAGVKLTTRARTKTAREQAVIASAEGRMTTAVLAAYGVTEDELFSKRFDTLGAYATGILTTAERAKVRAAAQAVGIDPDSAEKEYADEIDRRATAAAGLLVASLGMLARSALAGNPITVETTRGEFSGPVPFSVVRQAFDVATRGTPTPGLDQAGPGPDQLDELATALRDVGQTLVDDLLGQAGVSTAITSTWVHGDPDRPFAPHEELDGVSWESGGDYPDALYVDERGAWLDREMYEPGDHDGCTCTIETDWAPSDTSSGDLVASEGTPA